MIIDMATALYFVEAVRLGRIRGRGLTLGKLDPSFTFEQLGKLMARQKLLTIDGGMMSVSARQKAVVEHFQGNGRLVSHNPLHAQRGHISDEFFYRFIGLDEVYSVDHITFADADFAFDLNQPGLVRAVGTFDFVFDSGTMERVFHTPNLLQNLHEVLNVDGVVIHQSPTNNCLDRGFYQYSPAFFADYYGANGYADVEITLQRVAGEVTLSAPYHTGLLQAVLDTAPYTTRCFARKTAASTRDQYPKFGRAAAAYA
jgi:hypothetical protein